MDIYAGANIEEILEIIMKLTMLHEDLTHNSLKSEGERLRQAFDEMEGEGFFERSMADLEGFESLGGAYNKITSHEPFDDPYDEEDPKDIVFTVYGDGGWHRYHITVDGSILFSKMHAALPSSDEAIRKASSLKFELY